MTKAETAIIFNSMFGRLKPAETQAEMLFNALHETLNDPEVIRLHAYSTALRIPSSPKPMEPQRA